MDVLVLVFFAMGLTWLLGRIHNRAAELLAEVKGLRYVLGEILSPDYGTEGMEGHPKSTRQAVEEIAMTLHRIEARLPEE